MKTGAPARNHHGVARAVSSLIEILPPIPGFKRRCWAGHPAPSNSIGALATSSLVEHSCHVNSSALMRKILNCETISSPTQRGSFATHWECTLPYALLLVLFELATPSD